VGQEAAEFLRVTKDNEYFNRVLAELDAELTNAMRNLRPEDTMKFTILKAKLDCLYDPMRRIAEDISAGERAKARMDGKEEGGLL
jgi:hypothetical protein